MTPWKWDFIPAAPGYRAFNWRLSGGEVEITASPVLAWIAASSEREAAMTLEPLTDDALTPPFVLRPDGTVFQVEGKEFDSLDAFKAAVLAGEVRD